MWQAKTPNPELINARDFAFKIAHDIASPIRKINANLDECDIPEVHRHFIAKQIDILNKLNGRIKSYYA